MPGPITHLQAAYYYNVTHDRRFGSGIYLGSIIPDSVNVNGHAPKEKRWPAHLRDRDLDIWTANAKRFYNQNKGKVEEGCLRGYILHILTDIVWDRSFDRPLYECLLRDGVPERELKRERWNEIYGYEQTQLESPWFRNEVLLQLSAAEPLPIGTLDLREIKLWQAQIVSLNLPKGRTPKFVNEPLTDRFFKEVTASADRIFGEMGC